MRLSKAKRCNTRYAVIIVIIIVIDIQDFTNLYTAYKGKHSSNSSAFMVGFCLL